MGTQAEKKKFDGMSPRQAKAKLSLVFAKKCGHVTLDQADHEAATAYGIGLLALAEAWHELRSHNQTVELMIAAFAESAITRNKKMRALEETVFKQRKALEKLQNEFNALKAAGENDAKV